MFKTINQRTAWIAENDLHVNENGDILDNEGCLYNPWCFEYEHNGVWLSIVGICTDHDNALRRLYDLKQNNPTTRFRMYRGNDLEYLTVYTE